MLLPEAEHAIVDPAKIHGYLLSASHLLVIARTGEVLPGQASPFGVKFEVDGILAGPLGTSAKVRTVWIVGWLNRRCWLVFSRKDFWGSLAVS